MNSFPRMGTRLGPLVLAVAAFSGVPEAAAQKSNERPFLAIWRDSDGGRSRSQTPCLRVAIWNDGRIVFANDPTKWNQELRQGRINGARIAELKKAVGATGVFELKGNCYLVPDAPVDCLMLDFGGRQQMLYWDEVESPNYGINISPKAHHVQFKRCWKDVNKLALGAIPQQSQPFAELFARPPSSWRLKQPIQSE